MEPTQILLQQLFPQLPFAKDADEWLDTIEGKKLIVQLRERDISKVEIIPILRPSGLYINNEDWTLLVWINNVYSPERTAELLGHEIARTFFFLDPFRINLGLVNDKDIERFCATFSQYWLTKNNKTRIIQCCKNQAKLITQCDL